MAKRNENWSAARRHRRSAAGQQRSGNFYGNTIDLFGDAYEYLMQMYASTAGKSGGEFYTPQEVSELLARITVVGKKWSTRFMTQPAAPSRCCSMLRQVLGHDGAPGLLRAGINLTTYNLCRINMFLHDVNYEKFDIAHGDTLTDPAHWDDEPFEPSFPIRRIRSNGMAMPTRC